MIDPTEFAALNATAHQYHADQAKTGGYNPPAKKKQSGKGGILSSLISEAGGTTGAMGGAALGATLGSAVPVIGTAIGGLAGALIGGFAGGTGGRAVENKIRDNQNFLGEGGSAKAALTEGAISGAMGAGPLRLLKGGASLTKGAVAGTKGLAGALGSREAAQAAETAVAAPLKTSMAGKADALGNKMLGKSQWGVIDKPTIRSADPAGTTAKLSNMGLTKNTDIERTAQAITGADGILNKAVAGAVDQAHPLQVGHLPTAIETTIKKSGLVDNQAKGLTNEIAADINLIDPANPNSALDVMRNLKARQQEYLGKGGTYHLPTSADKKRAKVIGEIHDELQNTLYKTADANGNLPKVLTPELRSQLVGMHPGNAQWAAHVDKNIMGATSVGQLRSAQAPFVNATKLIANGEGNAHSAGGQMVNSANGIKGAIVDAAANLVKQPLQRTAGVAVKKVAPMLPGGAGMPQGATSGLAGALGGVTAPNMKGIVRNELFSQPLKQLATTPATADAMQVDPVTGQPIPQDVSQLPDQGQQQTGQFTDPANPTANQMLSPDVVAANEADQQQQNDPFNPANLQTNIAKIIANGGKMKDVQEYVALVDTISGLTASAAPAKLNAQTASSLASSANGSNTLNQLEGLFSQAGGGSGRIGGRIGNVMSKVGMNDNGQVYNDLAASSVSQLAKALNGGGQVSDTDAQVVIQALPRITDSPAVAQAKFNALKARLAAAQQNTLQFGGGATDTSNTGAQL